MFSVAIVRVTKMAELNSFILTVWQWVEGIAAFSRLAKRGS